MSDTTHHRPITFDDLWRTADRERFRLDVWSRQHAREGNERLATEFRDRCRVAEATMTLIDRCASSTVIRQHLADMAAACRALDAALETTAPMDAEEDAQCSA